MIRKELFCILKDGREVFQYTITNIHGESVSILDYGSTIQSILVRDRKGHLGDVVLGAAPEHFEECTYRGGTIGRCANRIGYGRCTIAGKNYQLEKNRFGHFLHGASGNYAEKLFSGDIFPDENRVEFTWIDNGEGGFDGTVKAQFSFSFDDESRLTLQLCMTSDAPTVLNPTNHAYINLSETGDARDHLLLINSDKIVTRGDAGLPNGGWRYVYGTPADFSSLRSIREAMNNDNVQYFEKPAFDEFYVFDGREYHYAAKLESRETGRIMKVYTDMPCLVFFCAGGRKPEYGKNNRLYSGYCAVCLETGFVPNAVNCPSYDSPVFPAGEKLSATTVYQFLANEN